MFKKRTFSMVFCREQNGEKMYTVQDESNEEVFVYQIFKEADAKAILYLIERSYDVALADCKHQIENIFS
jgi:hypothetical protein